VARGIVPDIVTDQTSAHDLIYGYVPAGLSLDQVRALRESDPQRLMARSTRSIAKHVGAMLAFQRAGAIVFDNGNLIRTQAKAGGVENAFDIPIFTEAFCGRCLRAPLARSAGSRSPAIDDFARSTTCCASLQREPYRLQLGEARARSHPVPGAPGPHRLARSWRTHRARPGS
jgi:hypothetical protein